MSRSASSPTVRQAELRLDRSPLAICRGLRRRQPVTVFLDGGGGFEQSWRIGPIVAVRPEVSFPDASAPGVLERLDDEVRRRRLLGGTAETGIVVLLSYEALTSRDPQQMVVFRVDASLRFLNGGSVLQTRRGAGALVSVEDLLADESARRDEPARRIGRPRTSLPRERYLRSVETVQSHIARGDIYQANLCQQFSAPYRGDVFELYASLVSGSAAPQSAFLEVPGQALASVSPEIFLRVHPPDRVETWPIKGTRPRGVDPATDAAEARALLTSAKDQAELLMIVDLERNDLSRVCRPGSVRVSELAALRSFAAVHHLVARVEGRLQADVGPAALIRATFPGGARSAGRRRSGPSRSWPSWSRFRATGLPGACSGSETMVASTRAS